MNDDDVARIIGGMAQLKPAAERAKVGFGSLRFAIEWYVIWSRRRRALSRLRRQAEADYWRAVRALDAEYEAAAQRIRRR